MHKKKQTNKQKQKTLRDRSLFTTGGMVKFRGEREIISPERGGGDAKLKKKKKEWGEHEILFKY